MADVSTATKTSVVEKRALIIAAWLIGRVLAKMTGEGIVPHK